MELSEELKLVESAKTDVAAFDKLYEHFFPKIFAYVLNRSSSREIAEDVTSQVFLACIESIKSFDTSKGLSLGAWLYRVANNKLIDVFRKNKRIVAAPTEEEPDSEIDYDAEIERDNLQKQIISVLRSINSRYQEIISLRYFTELSNSEISEVLEIEPAHVAVLLHRALQTFKKAYLKHFPDSEIFEVD